MDTSKKCTACNETKELSCFHRDAGCPDGYRGTCKDCVRLRPAERNGGSRRRKIRYELKNPRSIMLRSARKRAKKKGIPFSITLEDIPDIPEQCPALGILLKSGVGTGKILDSSPSLDRIIPALGYVPGNLAIISKKANAIKHNGCLEELKLVCEYVERALTNPQNLV